MRFIPAISGPHSYKISRFLLKYISKDEVELLGRGNGGIVEIRNAITQYEEPSPLFGFLRYRRRNVVIKCVPEECSRLVQGEFFEVEIFPFNQKSNVVQHALPFISTLSQNDFHLTIPNSL